ncbi:MAG TPA: amino acid permease [Solirubrobacteraceae bacterium]|nr:amino acid permease [Solirubrobacteraceae bacterium]
MTKPKAITWVTLAFMTTASVASLRSAPTMAVYGLACVFLYIVPAVVFLMPQALVAAELASGWSGGVFRWVSEGISPRWGLLAVWCQFAMTIFYYPTLLGFVASTLAYVFNPGLATNGVYTGVVIVVVFWTGVFLSARGGTGGIAKLASSGLVVGTLIPGAVLVVLGVVYLLQGNAPAAPMNASHLVPEWTGIASLVLIVNNFLSYSGMEMNAVHVSSLKKPGGEFPKAMFFAVGLVLVIFILPALAISWVIPADELSLTAGVMQAFDAFFAYFGLSKLVPIVAIALVCASTGGMLTWLAGPSKGLLLIARREGYLPPFFQEQNENGIPVHILVTQGAVTTVIALLYALIPSVSSAYWILSVMTTQVYLIVYLLMFVAARRLRRDQPEVQRGYKAPALTFMCSMGFVASAAAIIIGFVPPSQFESGSGVAYAGLILAGTALIGLIPPWLFLRFRKPDWKTPEAAGPDEGAPEASAPVPPAPTAVDTAAAAIAVPSTSAPQAPPPLPPPPTSTPVPEPSSGGDHRRLYWLIGAVVVALLVVGLITFSAEKKDMHAQEKAQQLTQKLQQAGLPVPASQDTIISSLGTDGGAVCENPANALGKALLFEALSNGADFVGRRPVIADRRAVQGEALILQTYCPDKAQKYQETIQHLKYENTIRP